MSIFDVFSGDAAREAAEKNAALYSQYENRGLGYLDAAYPVAQQNLQQGLAAFQPLGDLAGKYGGATSMYLDALGVNAGRGGNARARNAFQAGPGYQFAMGQGLDALDRRAASRGMLASGNNNLDTINYAQGLANQEYGNWMNRLGGFVAPELQATAGAATGRAAGYGGLANLAQTDAQNRVNVVGNATSGMANSNTSAAQAEMQGSANLWGGLMNLAGGYFKGGGKLFG